MRRSFVTAAILALAACDTPADMLGDPNMMIDRMKGQGSVQRSASGADRFTYVAPADLVLNGRKATPAELKAHHEWLIESYVGRQQICPRGYTTTSQPTAGGFVTYTGTCK